MIPNFWWRVTLSVALTAGAWKKRKVKVWKDQNSGGWRWTYVEEPGSRSDWILQA